MRKTYKIQKEDESVTELEKQFKRLDLSKILDVQNEVSRDVKTGFIWVLNTCVLLVPDYNFKVLN